MITARTPARRLTWILLPAPGLDFQPQTQTAFYILARRQGFCKIFLLGHTVCVPVNGAKNCIDARKVSAAGHCRLLRGAASPLRGLQALAWGGFTAAGHSKLLRGAASPLRGIPSSCAGRLHRCGACAFPPRFCFKRNLDVFHENQVYVLNFPLFCIFILI